MEAQSPPIVSDDDERKFETLRSSRREQFGFRVVDEVTSPRDRWSVRTRDLVHYGLPENEDEMDYW